MFLRKGVCSSGHAPFQMFPFRVKSLSDASAQSGTRSPLCLTETDHARETAVFIMKKAEQKFIKISKPGFYALSLTWGGLLTAIGLFVSAVMLLTGHKPRKWGYCWYFEVGKKNWGGCEWGPVFLKDRFEGEHIKNHEFGHGIQNCFFGPFMIFLISMPSSIRYWYRRIRTWRKKPLKTAYDDIWFEGQATRLGTEKIKRLRTEHRRAAVQAGKGER